MTTDPDLFKAILALDTYNRGYDEGLPELSESIGTKLGDAEIIQNSRILNEDPTAPRVDANASFYGLAYKWGGKVIISYRGTDDPLSDIANGYGTGAGSPDSAQALLAAEFYQKVANQEGRPDWFNTSIELTGHSLGGGLAGLK